MFRRLCYGLFLLFFFACIHSFAGEKPVTYLGIEQGLSNNAVTSIYQDHNGFMWFGTYDGLNRYDGYGFKIFRNVIGNETSLCDNHISGIEGDAQHNLWIGCEGGLSIYNPVKANFYTPLFIPWSESTPQSFHSHVHALQRLANGEGMLIGVESKGLLLFTKGSLTGRQIPLLKANGYEKNYSVTALSFDSSTQVVWAFVSGTGLCQYRFNEKGLRIVNESIKDASCLKKDSKGMFWLGNEAGLFRYDAKANIYAKNVLPAAYKVANLFEDKKGVLWIASDGGGLWSMSLDSNTPLQLMAANGKPLINSNAVVAVYEDGEGSKWIGTLRGGINILNPQSAPFKHIVYNDGGQNNIINNFILSFAEDAAHNVWVGTDGAGLRYWNRQNNSYLSFVHNPSNASSISSNFITNVLCDSHHDVWIATWFGGVNRLKKGTNSFERFPCYNPFTGSVENNAWLLFEDAKGRLWASTTNEGTLYLFNRGANRFEIFDKSISNLQCLTEDEHEQLWGGNYSTVINIDPLNKKHRSFPVGNTVRCLHADKAGNFWVGTDGGGLLLFNRDNGTFSRFTTTEGLPSNTVLRMLEDNGGNLWLSTYNGLCKFNPVAKTCRNFSQSDGLQSNQFSFNAGLVLKSGEFLFGGIKGFNLFYPDSVTIVSKTLPVFLTGVKIANKPIEDDDAFVTKRSFEKVEAVKLPYSEASLSLDLIALAYTGADKIKYAYKLEGWDKTWNEVANVRSANYSRLGEGTYTFKVKVTNAAGGWGQETTLLTVVVLPPWYRTWWAYGLYFLLVASVISLYITYAKRQERLKYEMGLARMEQEKEKELTEKKISFFTHISHEFRTPLTLIINPLKELLHTEGKDTERKSIGTVYRNARRLLSLVDQLLLFRKVESIDQHMHIERFNLTEACNEVYLSFAQHALSKNIDFVFEKQNDAVSVYADKEKVEIILFNLLSNAFKYTEAGGKIVLQLSEHEAEIEIMVTDTGCGIPSAVGNQLFDSFYRVDESDKTRHTGFGIGLHVSKKLAEAHYGQLSYTSREGEGTAFRLLLRSGKAHFASQHISDDFKCSETILHELVEEPSVENESTENASPAKNKATVIDKLTSDLPAMVIVDDNAEIRAYLRQIFHASFTVSEAADGEEGYERVLSESPEIVISDVMMKNVGGIELCRKIKSNPSLAHIPVVLLTASSSDASKLQGIEGGAEDYITKPFDRDIIVARVQNILKGRNRLQQYFFNAVTLKPTTTVAGEHKEFIERCMAVVDAHLDNPEFTINTLSREMGMSHPSLYKKVKTVSGLTVNVFIRYIRLRKAAELLITTDKTILEVTYLTGFNDVRYFREQFQKLFQMKPSDYVKRYRKVLGSKHPVGD